MRYLVLALALFLPGCETMQAIQNSTPPQTFLQGLAQAQGEIATLRDLTAFTLNAEGENCIERPSTDLCAAAFKIDTKTREFSEKLDMIKTAYLRANGVLTECAIVYGGVTLPCETEQDVVLAGLIELRKLLPEGDK